MNQIVLHLDISMFYWFKWITTCLPHYLLETSGRTAASLEVLVTGRSGWQTLTPRPGQLWAPDSEVHPGHLLPAGLWPPGTDPGTRDVVKPGHKSTRTDDFTGNISLVIVQKQCREVTYIGTCTENNFSLILLSSYGCLWDITLLWHLDIKTFI